MISSAAQSLNRTERINLYYEIQETIVDQAAYLWVYQGVNFHVEYYWVYGYVFNPIHEPYFYRYYKSMTLSTTTTTTQSTPTTTTTTPTTTTTTTTTSTIPTTTDTFDLSQIMAVVRWAITIGSVAVIVVFAILIGRHRISHSLQH